MKIISRFFTIVFCTVLLSPCAVLAQDPESAQNLTDTKAVPVANDAPAIGATCAQQVFADALLADAASVTEDSTEGEIQTWIYKNFQSSEVIKKVLACPEVSALDEEENFVVPPVEYQFPGDRKIVVNYETQPKILRQRMLIAGKQPLPCSGDECVSPRVGAPGDTNIWTNTDPAWYGILVVQAGALDAFIGEEKNNTISLKYLEDNINNFYPRNYNEGTAPVTANPSCTTRSAFAHDDDIVNQAAVRSVGLESYGDENGDGQKDTNDYYIAGDVSLQWITWAEVALDVAIEVATVGGGTFILGASKGIRTTKAAKTIVESINVLKNTDKVKDYLIAFNKVTKSAEELKNINKVTDAARWAAKSDELKDLEKVAKELEKADDVKKYKEAVGTFRKLQDLRRGMKAWKIPQRGNVIARGWRMAKGLRALNKGEKVISKAEKIGRAGIKSGKIRTFLFAKTTALKAAGLLAKMERQAGLLYGAIKFAGDMYDWTETSTGEFTSNIEFKPLGLLSADDMTGQENVVNHGMWLLWAGDSTSSVDDDAAFLQAMDFASKFSQDMQEVQDEETEKGRSASTMCDVDIFVVRPIIKNPDSENPELYYLIMNDVPWSLRSNGK